jgi:hypothetical protein
MNPMKNLIYALMLVLPILAPLNLQAKNDVLTVAIFDFESKDENTRDLGPKIALLLNAQLSTDSQIITVERAELEKIAGEQELGLSGTVSTDTAARVGHLTGAKILITGRAFKVEKDLVIIAKIISTETSRIYAEMVQGPQSSLSDLAVALSQKIIKDIHDKADTLVAQGLSSEERIDKMIKPLKSGTKPSVFIQIEEKHFGNPVIDPAAETEMGKILTKAGFTLLTSTSKEKPRFEISGEAFSAVGIRKGNLISCRSRVELKVTEKETGKILLVDRQTSSGVDITEQTAAKTALQNAVIDIAERLLPKLAESK